MSYEFFFVRQTRQLPQIQRYGNEASKYMNSAKFANGRLMRWAMFLQSYSFTVEAIMGSPKIQTLILNTTTYTCHRPRPAHACDR